MSSLFPDPPPLPFKPQREEPPATVAEIRRLAKKKIMELVLPALDALKSTMTHPDEDSAVVVKAACAVLDRAGFGVHSTITVDDGAPDFHELPMEVKRERLQKVLERLGQSQAIDVPFKIEPATTSLIH